ncbi:MAG: substrate-binding domain-containing protein [Oscillospiraceae bacterium]|jgi:phosphate transport system substrate-binding protein|nr:substrate-binding domain-containing protein [Oscillospiraceae bacterium]
MKSLRTVSIFLLLMLFTISASAEENSFALGGKTKVSESAFEMDYGTYPSIDGSTVMLTLAQAFAQHHLGMTEEDAREFVFFNTTPVAHENLILKRGNPGSRIPSQVVLMDAEHPVDLFIGTGLSDEEREFARQNNVELVEVPICRDAFVFVVHANNPVASLTLEQIRGIYREEVYDWSDVGGGEERYIFPLSRNANSGSQTAMVEMVMQGDSSYVIGNERYMSGEMSWLLQWVGGYDKEVGDNAIGYSFLYYVKEMADIANVKVIAVDGVHPTYENIVSGEYPLVATYYAVYRKEDEDGAAGKFVEWILSQEGRELIEQAGYIPLEQE